MFGFLKGGKKKKDNKSKNAGAAIEALPESFDIDQTSEHFKTLERVSCFSFDPAQQILAVGFQDKKLVLYGCYGVNKEFNNLSGSVTNITFSINQPYLFFLISKYDEENGDFSQEINCINLESFNLIWSFPWNHEKEGIISHIYCPMRSNHVVFASEKGKIFFGNIQTHKFSTQIIDLQSLQNPNTNAKGFAKINFLGSSNPQNQDAQEENLLFVGFGADVFGISLIPSKSPSSGPKTAAAQPMPQQIVVSHVKFSFLTPQQSQNEEEKAKYNALKALSFDIYRKDTIIVGYNDGEILFFRIPSPQIIEKKGGIVEEFAFEKRTLNLGPISSIFSIPSLGLFLKCSRKMNNNTQHENEEEGFFDPRGSSMNNEITPNGNQNSSTMASQGLFLFEIFPINEKEAKKQPQYQPQIVNLYPGIVDQIINMGTDRNSSSQSFCFMRDHKLFIFNFEQKPISQPQVFSKQLQQSQQIQPQQNYIKTLYSFGSFYTEEYQLDSHFLDCFFFEKLDTLKKIKEGTAFGHFYDGIIKYSERRATVQGGIPAFDANSKTDLMLLATETGLVLIDGSYNPTTVACVPLSDCFQSNSDVGVHFFKWSEAIAMIMNKKGDISMITASELKAFPIMAIDSSQDQNANMRVDEDYFEKDAESSTLKQSVYNPSKSEETAGQPSVPVMSESMMQKQQTMKKNPALPRIVTSFAGVPFLDIVCFCYENSTIEVVSVRDGVRKVVSEYSFENGSFISEISASSFSVPETNLQMSPKAMLKKEKTPASPTPDTQIEKNDNSPPITSVSDSNSSEFVLLVCVNHQEKNNSVPYLWILKLPNLEPISKINLSAAKSLTDKTSKKKIIPFSNSGESPFMHHEFDIPFFLQKKTMRILPLNYYSRPKKDSFWPMGLYLFEKKAVNVSSLQMQLQGPRPNLGGIILPFVCEILVHKQCENELLPFTVTFSVFHDMKLAQDNKNDAEIPQNNRSVPYFSAKICESEIIFKIFNFKFETYDTREVQQVHLVSQLLNSGSEGTTNKIFVVFDPMNAVFKICNGFGDTIASVDNFLVDTEILHELRLSEISIILENQLDLTKNTTPIPTNRKKTPSTSAIPAILKEKPKRKPRLIKRVNCYTQCNLKDLLMNGRNPNWIFLDFNEESRPSNNFVLLSGKEIFFFQNFTPTAIKSVPISAIPAPPPAPAPTIAQAAVGVVSIPPQKETILTLAPKKVLSTRNQILNGKIFNLHGEPHLFVLSQTELDIYSLPDMNYLHSFSHKLIPKQIEFIAPNRLFIITENSIQEFSISENFVITESNDIVSEKPFEEKFTRSPQDPKIFISFTSKAEIKKEKAPSLTSFLSKINSFIWGPEEIFNSNVDKFLSSFEQIPDALFLSLNNQNVSNSTSSNTHPPTIITQQPKEKEKEPVNSKISSKPASLSQSQYNMRPIDVEFRRILEGGKPNASNSSNNLDSSLFADKKSGNRDKLGLGGGGSASNAKIGGTGMKINEIKDQMQINTQKVNERGIKLKKIEETMLQMESSGQQFQENMKKLAQKSKGFFF